MSFFTLLILLSLIIIVPLFFVLKEKSKQTQIDTTQRHQAYLAAASQPTASATKVPDDSRNPTTTHQDNVIAFSAQHPLIRLLYNPQVPSAFQAIIDDIGQQYESIHHAQITESQLFTLNKLVETRIPELVDDYLSLDAHYANHVIIDSKTGATSYTIVLNQLRSVLSFAQKLNNQSQSGVVDKLLASQRYLEEVYKDSGTASTDDLLNLK